MIVPSSQSSKVPHLFELIFSLSPLFPEQVKLRLHILGTTLVLLCKYYFKP